MSNEVEVEIDVTPIELQPVVKTDQSTVYCGYFPPVDHYRQSILDIPLLDHPEIKGKPTTRNFQYFSDLSSDDYKIQGTAFPCQALTQELQELLQAINTLFNLKLTKILITTFVEGTDYIGKYTLPNQDTITLNLGTTRELKLRPKPIKSKQSDTDSQSETTSPSETTSKPLTFDVGDGDLFWFTGNFQKEFTWEIPSRKKVTEPFTVLMFF